MGVRAGNLRSVTHLRRVASYHPLGPQLHLIVGDGSFAQATQRREHGFFHFAEPFLHVASGLEAFSQANLENSQSHDNMAHVGLVGCPSCPSVAERWATETLKPDQKILELSIATPLCTSLCPLY